MTLDEILSQLRDVDPELTPDEQASARRGLLDEVLSAADVDVNALSAAAKEKAQAVDPSANDITEEALVEIGLIAEVSEAVNTRVAAIHDQQERERRATTAARLAEKIAATAMVTNTQATGTVTASTGTKTNTGANLARREATQMIAASDMPGFFSGQTIPDMKSLTNAVIGRAAKLARSGAGRQVQVASFQRQTPETHRVEDEMRDWMRITSASDERRLPGGSLAASLLKKQSLTASTPVPPGIGSGGYAWCAPMEIRDEECQVEGSLDGLLDIPTIVTTRGGVMWPASPDFTALYQPFTFSDGDFTAGYELEKPCVSLPCPEGWDECRLKGASMCLETGIIQSHVAPEQVQRAMTEMMIAHQHYLNGVRIQSMVDDIAAESGGHTDLSDWGGHGPGLYESLLSFLDLQATRFRERRRLPFGTTVEVAMPTWSLGVLRADMSKKNALAGRWSTGDQEIMTHLLSRGIRPQFVRDWQDEEISGDALPTQWPSKFTFLMYTAGAYLGVAGPSIQMEMIHDKQLIQRNREIRLFAEDTYCMIRRCGQAASFTVPLCPNGMSGGQERIECTSGGAAGGGSVRVAESRSKAKADK
ncbi:major capsid protein [Streptomyces sp. NPDC000927]|uniref:major capsid protein n=1 Tax=Streptomyces sp. NPDC000927 TaxID=3154371 RepID=UPI00331A5E45